MNAPGSCCGADRSSASGSPSRLAQGIIHPYYTVALAAPLGGLVGIATMGLWERRATWAGRLGLAAGLGATVWWSYVLLVAPRTGSRPCAPSCSSPGSSASSPSLLCRCSGRPQTGHRRRVGARPERRAGRAALLDRGHGGHAAQWGHPVGDPDAQGGFGGPGGGFGGAGFGGGGFRRAFAGGGLPGAAAGGTFPGGGTTGGGSPAPGRPEASRADRGPTASAAGPASGAPAFGGTGTGGAARAFGGGGVGGGGGGFLSSSTSNPELTKKLQADASQYKWVAATVNSNNAAGYQLASGDPVMAIGGFNGTDPAPTLAEFEKYVADGQDPLLHRRRRTAASAAVRSVVAEARVTTPRRSRHGSSRTTRLRRSTARRSTT